MRTHKRWMEDGRGATRGAISSSPLLTLSLEHVAAVLARFYRQQHVTMHMLTLTKTVIQCSLYPWRWTLVDSVLLSSLSKEKCSMIFRKNREISVWVSYTYTAQLLRTYNILTWS